MSTVEKSRWVWYSDVMTTYIPTEGDFEPSDIVALAEGNIEPIANRLNISKVRLQYLIQHDEEATDLIVAARMEFEEMARLRLAILIPNAINTLEQVMNGKGPEKKVMAQVKAAEAVMDRSFLPKQIRASVASGSVGPSKHGLPNLDELMEKASSPEEAMQFFERHQRLMEEIDALRRNAKEIIDVQAVIRSEVQEKTRP